MQQFLNAVRSRHLYHFTDTRNLASIRQHGLLSLAELQRRKVSPVAYGGDEQSRRSDRNRGLDDYVHLCLTQYHPMEYRAVEDGRIEESIFIKVLPSLLDRQGIKFAGGPSNSPSFDARPIEEIDDALDFEVTFKKTDWNDPVIKPRLQAARKFEILIPKVIEPELLKV